MLEWFVAKESPLELLVTITVGSFLPPAALWDATVEGGWEEEGGFFFFVCFWYAGSRAFIAKGHLTPR